MKVRRQRDNDRPIGKLMRIADFLPAPEELMPSRSQKKITILLDAGTIQFFKEAALKYGLKYQQMMREILKRYAEKYGT